MSGALQIAEKVGVRRVMTFYELAKVGSVAIFGPSQYREEWSFQLELGAGLAQVKFTANKFTFEEGAAELSQQLFDFLGAK